MDFISIGNLGRDGFIFAFATNQAPKSFWIRVDIVERICYILVIFVVNGCTKPISKPMISGPIIGRVVHSTFFRTVSFLLSAIISASIHGEVFSIFLI